MSTISQRNWSSVKGWLGPALTETFETPRLLRELGLTYILDWCADDQPFPINVPGMISVPYSIELNDISMFVGKSLPGEAFYQAAVDQFDQLYKESAQSGRVMSLCLHPFIINVPFRHKYLEKALEYIPDTMRYGSPPVMRSPPITPRTPLRCDLAKLSGQLNLERTDIRTIGVTISSLPRYAPFQGVPFMKCFLDSDCPACIHSRKGIRSLARLVFPGQSNREREALARAVLTLRSCDQWGST